MLRSIKKAYEMIHRADPGSAVTIYIIRQWCKEKKVRCLTAGTKILVDYESLQEYISLGSSNYAEEN